MIKLFGVALEMDILVAENLTLRKEIELLRKYKKEVQDVIDITMDEKHDSDERHCVCVPYLRIEVERLRQIVKSQTALINKTLKILNQTIKYD